MSQLVAPPVVHDRVMLLVVDVVDEILSGLGHEGASLILTSSTAASAAVVKLDLVALNLICIVSLA